MTEADSFQQKITKIEEGIFKNSESLMNTIDVSKPVKYPELRKSSNTNRFQKNLRPRSHSRSALDRSKSNVSRNTNGRGTGVNLMNFKEQMESIVNPCDDTSIERTMQIHPKLNQNYML